LEKIDSIELYRSKETHDRRIIVIKKSITPQEVVDFLNSLMDVDPVAMHKLVFSHKKCNDDLADHPTVQVEESATGQCSVGLMGILNGLFGVYDDGPYKNHGIFQALFDRNQDNKPRLKEFRILENKDD